MADTAIDGARVLWVDDDALIRTVGVTLLKQAGAQVSVASNGLDALECLLMERFDCIVMDVQMPVMDGLQATRLIRANPLTAHVPIIALTGNTLGDERVRCAAAGMNEFLAKPVAPLQLQAAVARCLNVRSVDG